MGGISSDNVHGLVLAISSSVFIGSSFIIKKKGLKKAGVSGIRAGLVSLCLFFLMFLTLPRCVSIKFFVFRLMTIVELFLLNGILVDVRIMTGIEIHKNVGFSP